MKVSKLIISVVFFSQLIFSQSESNTRFGIKGGVSLTFFNQFDGANFGFDQRVLTEAYGGVFVDFKIDEGFHIQPELLYIGLGDFEFLNAPIYVKYDVAKAISLAVGPSMNYFFDLFVNKFKIRGDINTAWHLNDDLDINLKYTLGFEEFSPKVLFIGLGYRF
ncbi:hypothetical protein RM697_02240 [Ichthyenterobacterium sp. W332]|uniref:Outer membrane protein beta-barrel domain-containing protein n=1 Tax=Microcosmobacter mediterraneus TaxID=3075607 RepID=A0ABU2YGZ9_9FLAO|nr:hypothetical protein [Ichthyenterobacterium sp. W332]MDT0557449.1 hypothetical protein [Ichthyenterobacterium sp. W332]